MASVGKKEKGKKKEHNTKAEPIVPLSQIMYNMCVSKCSVWFSDFLLLKTRVEPHCKQNISLTCQTFLGGDLMTETTPLAWATGQNKSQVRQRVHLIKSALYAGQTFYAFMLM